ncbi:MAG: endonuclease/exonuclease/phosphatase family protein [Deltaproteobacteria bacterium]|nr:endonuclease/exonuclease/phosphatase family protein [Deltaproteobacteria bacterium]
MSLRSLNLGVALVGLACLPAAGTAGGGAVQRPDAAAPAPDAAVAPRLAVATFNVHRLFDMTCDTGACGETDYEAHPTADEFRTRTLAVGAGVQLLGVDVAVLQEIESQACMDALQQALTAPFPVAVLGETGGAASLDVAVLARGELVATRSHAAEVLPRADGGVTTFARDLLEVHLRVGTAHVVVFAAHFRSKRSDDPDRRLAEARAARRIIDGVAATYPDAVVVLGGDLNDTPGSAPLHALETDGGLIRVAQWLPAAEQATYHFNGQGQALDHLYVLPAAAPRIILESVRVIHDVPLPTGGFAGSDHAALRAEVLLP